MKRIPLDSAILAVALAALRRRRAAGARTAAAAASGQGRARQVPRHHVRLQRLPHAVEDGAERPRARHDARMLSGHPQDMVMPPPPKPGGPWIVGGSRDEHRVAGPWGVSFTANLTPDPETGLGKWTLRNFTDTIRTGRHMGRGRPMLPPMPIPVYSNFTDDDLEPSTPTCRPSRR